MLRVRRALISLADKRDSLSLCSLLKEFHIDAIATGQTAQVLREHINITEVADLTGFPEILDGRVKTLNPKIHAGILARKDRPEDMKSLEEQHIKPIDLVVVNLYDFATAVRKGFSREQIIEQIDIGGSALLRAAAKNYRSVALITSPDDYDSLTQEMFAYKGCVSMEFRAARVARAFALSANYDSRISKYFQTDRADKEEKEELLLAGHLVRHLRYGENPHQKAALYADSSPPRGLAAAQCLQGKPLSYNNLLDADRAYRMVRQFRSSACAVIKHANPCGVARQESQRDAYLKALAADGESAFGGIIAFNEKLAEETAALIAEKQFAEVVVAPQFPPRARKQLSVKKNMRLLLYDEQDESPHGIRSIEGGFLLQDADNKSVDSLQWVTKRRALEHTEDMLFAWKVVKLCHSNAVVIAKKEVTCGIGSGQTSRVFSVRCALMRAADNGISLDDAVLASDAFFPFPDSIELLKGTGIVAIIQPGGSKRDAEVIKAADAQGLAMAFTGQRSFFHG